MNFFSKCFQLDSYLKFQIFATFSPQYAYLLTVSSKIGLKFQILMTFLPKSGYVDQELFINLTTFKENFCFLKQVFKKIAAKLGNSPPLASRAGLPSKYRRGSMLLNFDDRTTTGVYSILRGSPHHHPLLQILFESQLFQIMSTF